MVGQSTAIWSYKENSPTLFLHSTEVDLRNHCRAIQLNKVNFRLENLLQSFVRSDDILLVLRFH